MRYKIFCAAVIAAMFLVSGCVFGEEIAYDNLKSGTVEWSLFTGVGRNYHYPSSTKSDFKFDIIGLRYLKQHSPHTAVGYEFGTGIDLLNDDNPNTYGIFCYQQYLKTSENDALTLDLSIGVARLKNNVPELGTKTNFTERIGVTYKWKKNDDSAWFANIYFCHMSNAGLKFPNIGINAAHFVFGHSWYNIRL